MALMLRGVGVPARIVSGFKGGRWDDRKNQLVVEQRHAHAWVEAFVGGRWLVFDPTTARDDYGQDGSGGLGYSLAALWGHLNSFWQNKIIGVSLARQQSDIYEPIMKGLNNARAGGLNLVESFQNRLQSSPGRGLYRIICFMVRCCCFALSSLPLSCCICISARPFICLAGVFRPASVPRLQQMLQFFRRFLEISALNGLRKAQLTAREFALLFQERFRWQLQLNSLEELPLSLTNAYYQARFRGDKLSESDLEHWKKRLDSLGHVLNQRRETGRSRVSQ
ncbi:MAG: transglutaminase-like domain-containing protein [Planctomycetaceae bacterium]